MPETKKVRMLRMEVRERTRTPRPAMPDSVLAQHYLAGDQQAFEVLVQRYSGPLFTFIRRFLGEYDAASDILQQVLRSEEHTSELQSHSDLVCRLLLEKKNTHRDHS